MPIRNIYNTKITIVKYIFINALQLKNGQILLTLLISRSLKIVANYYVCNTKDPNEIGLYSLKLCKTHLFSTFNVDEKIECNYLSN